MRWIKAQCLPMCSAGFGLVISGSGRVRASKWRPFTTLRWFWKFSGNGLSTQKHSSRSASVSPSRRKIYVVESVDILELKRWVGHRGTKEKVGGNVNVYPSWW